MKHFIFIILLSVFSVWGKAQTGKVNWIDIEKADQLMKDNPKKMLIFLYTDWCGYCKLMDRKVFQDKEIATYINEHYYPVKFNAERKDPIEFDGYEYEFVPNKPRGAHQFAIDLLQGQMAYPGLVLLEEDKDLINRFVGVQPKDLLQQYLEYVSEDIYLKEDWFEYSGQKERN